MNLFFLPLAIVAFIELVKRAWARDWQTVVIILGAALIGAVAGWFRVDNLTVMSGILAGLSAPGVYQLFNVSGK